MKFSLLYTDTQYEFDIEFSKNLSCSDVAFVRCKLTCIWSHKKESNLHRSQSFSALNTYNTHGNVENCWSLIATFNTCNITEGQGTSLLYLSKMLEAPHGMASNITHLVKRMFSFERFVSVCIHQNVILLTKLLLCIVKFLIRNTCN